MKGALTQARLKELIHYDPETGDFTARSPRTGVSPADGCVGWIENTGYRRIEVDRVRYVASRLAWLYMTGELPDRPVDHKNRVRSDNRWENLRAATNSLNGANTNIQRNNTSGAKGVHWCASIQRWRSKITKDGVIYLNNHKTFEDAVRFRDALAVKLYGDFATTQQSILDLYKAITA